MRIRGPAGEFLGAPTNTAELRAYTRTVPMAGKTIDACLRDFLEGFRCATRIAGWQLTARRDYDWQRQLHSRAPRNHYVRIVITIT
jgi:hypothetical protein